MRKFSNFKELLFSKLCVMWKKCRHCGKGDFSSAPRTPNLRLETDNASSTHEKPWNAYRENLSLADAFWKFEAARLSVDLFIYVQRKANSSCESFRNANIRLCCKLVMSGERNLKWNQTSSTEQSSEQIVYCEQTKVVAALQSTSIPQQHQF